MQAGGGSILTNHKTWLLGIAAIAVLAVVLAACSSEDAGPTATPEATSAPEPTAVPTTTPGPTIDASDVTIIMRRGTCFGACPQYRITIQGDGSFEYEGIANVGLLGTASYTMPPEDIQRLLARFDEIGFADLDDIYRCSATDMPTTVTSIIRGDVEKSVSRCPFSSAPFSLIELEDLIDTLTNSVRWG